MVKENNTARIGFEEKIWQAADILRGNMDAAEWLKVHEPRLENGLRHPL